MSKHDTQTASEVEKGAPGAEDDVEEVRDDLTEHMRDKDDAADIALAAVDELADRAGELESLQKQLDDANEQLLRKAAEFKNYRRRTEQEKTQLIELGKSIVIQQFLDVLDDFRRSMEAAEQVEEQESESGSAYKALKEGVDLVYKKFMDQLSKHGVEPIEAVGQPFDENLHEAMMQQPTDDAEPGIVIQEIQKGYRMRDRILRHAKVVVAA